MRPNNRRHFHTRWYVLGRKNCSRIRGESGGDLFVTQFVPIAENARKPNAAAGPFWDGLDSRWYWSHAGLSCRSGAGNKRERNAVDLGVFGFKSDELNLGFVDGNPHRCRRVTAPAQSPANDLFAKQLRSESAYSQNVRHGVGIPTFREHRDAYDALNLFAKLARLADRIHH